LIAERRIEFVKVGRHVRISESALAHFIHAGRVEPLTDADIRHKMKRGRVMANREGHRRFGNVRKRARDPQSGDSQSEAGQDE
jgi:hypothetical protein